MHGLLYVNIRLFKGWYNACFLYHGLNICFSKRMYNMLKMYVKHMLLDS